MPFPTPNTMESTPPEVSDKNKDGDESSKVESFETVTVDDLLNIPLPQDDDVKANTGICLSNLPRAKVSHKHMHLFCCVKFSFYSSVKVVLELFPDFGRPYFQCNIFSRILPVIRCLLS